MGSGRSKIRALVTKRRNAINCRPGKPYGQRAAQAVIEPRPGSLMLHERADVGVDEKIGVEQNHRKASSSATASASVTLSRSPIRHRPKDTASVR